MTTPGKERLEKGWRTCCSGPQRLWSFKCRRVDVNGDSESVEEPHGSCCVVGGKNDGGGDLCLREGKSDRVKKMSGLGIDHTKRN